MEHDEQLIGRHDELDSVTTFLARTPDALPAALVLQGAAGIGKTVLWRTAVDQARRDGGTVLASALALGEARLAFAGLADLVEDVWDDVAGELARPQRTALEHALLLREGTGSSPDERAVAFGFLGLVRALARARPLTIAIDDLQWLDASSTAMLSYMLRRLRTEPVRFLLACRLERGVDPDPLRLERAEGVAVDVVAVGPFTLGALHHLLRRRLGRSLARPTLSRIHSASRGNPLHALELARTLETPGGDSPGSLPSLMRARITALPDDTRHALLLASLTATPSLATLTTAGVVAPTTVLAPALAADLVTLEAGGVRFTHPLVATAAVETCDEEQQRQGHRLLAAGAATDEVRARHLGRGASGHDEAIAAALEDAAARARRRGATAAGAELYQEAAALTPATSLEHHGRRLLEAGRASFDAGDADRARSLLRSAVETLPEGLVRCEARLRLGTVLDETGDPAEAQRTWREALGATDDPRLTAELERSLAYTTLYIGSVPEAARHAATAVAAAERSGMASTLAYALGAQALIAVVRGSPEFEEALEQALLLDREPHELLGEWSPTAVAAECGRLTGRTERTREAYEAVLAQAVASGDVARELWAAFGLSSTELLAGRLDRARELADLVLDLADQTQLMRIPAAVHAANVSAHGGELEASRAIVVQMLEQARATGEHVYELNILHALGFIEASRGDAAGAAAVYGQARTVAREIGVRHATVLRSLLLEAEAAADADLPDQAATALAEYGHAITPPFEPPWLGNVARRAAAAVAVARGDPAEGRELLEAATATPDESVPFEATRTRLAYGSLLRRQRAHAAGRVELGEAVRRFEQLGATAWARRAAGELARIPGRAARSHDGLTDAEQLIAAQVARGRSNKEVAAELHVSVKTVEVTLTRVYRKLGVRSRAELAARFAADSKP